MSFTRSLLSSALFVLVGLEVVGAVLSLGQAGLAHGLIVAAAVAAAVVGTRFAWLLSSPYLIRALDQGPQLRRLRLGARPRWTGPSRRGLVAVQAYTTVAVGTTVGAGGGCVRGQTCGTRMKRGLSGALLSWL